MKWERRAPTLSRPHSVLDSVCSSSSSFSSTSSLHTFAQSFFFQPSPFFDSRPPYISSFCSFRYFSFFSFRSTQRALLRSGVWHKFRRKVSDDNHRLTPLRTSVCESFWSDLLGGRLCPPRLLILPRRYRSTRRDQQQRVTVPLVPSLFFFLPSTSLRSFGINLATLRVWIYRTRFHIYSTKIMQDRMWVPAATDTKEGKGGEGEEGGHVSGCTWSLQTHETVFFLLYNVTLQFSLIVDSIL